MPESIRFDTTPVRSPDRLPTREAIARAAERTGVDFDYLLAQAKIESGLNPDAQAPTSSAQGLYQFISQTWLRTLDRHGAQHGYSWASDAIDQVGGRAVVADRTTLSQLLALRRDPEMASLMAAELASDNAAHLQPVLGRAPDAAELYLAHFMGAGGAVTFLSGLKSDPDQSAAALFPKPAAANRAIFFKGGTPRSLGEVMDLLRAKVSNAMESGGPPQSTAAPAFAQAAPGTFSASPSSPAAPPTLSASPSRRFGTSALPGLPAATGPRPSMAQTLRETFGSHEMSGTRASAHASAAYARLAAFGL